MDPAPFQFSLLSPPARSVAGPRASEQTRELVRCEGRIAELVESFCRARVGQEFRMAELTDYVARFVTVAPDSPRRVLGQLRRTGQVDVELLNRSSSLYAVRAAAAGGRDDHGI